MHIVLKALHLRDDTGVPSSESMDTWQLLSDDTRAVIHEIYRALSVKFTRFSRHDERDILVMVRKCVFGLCVPEGYIMLRGDADEALRNVVLDGFLIEKADLRSAWQLARRQILLLCAGTWQMGGSISLTMPEIQTEAEEALKRITALDEAVRTRPAYLDQIREIMKDMLESPTPFTFTTAADELRREIHLDLTTGYRRAEVSSTGTGEIPLAAVDIDTARAEHIRRCGFDSIRLDSIDTPEYIERVRAMWERLPIGERRSIPADASLYMSAVWCYVFTKDGDSYISPLSPDMFPQLYAEGCIPYHMLYRQFLSARDDANGYFAKLDMVPAEKSSFFGKLFGKR